MLIKINNTLIDTKRRSFFVNDKIAIFEKVRIKMLMMA